MAVASKLHNLVDLAKEKSSERRRDLMREVTDLFFESEPESGTREHAEFDTVLSRLAAQTAQEQAGQAGAPLAEPQSEPQP